MVVAGQFVECAVELGAEAFGLLGSQLEDAVLEQEWASTGRAVRRLVGGVGAAVVVAGDEPGRGAAAGKSGAVGVGDPLVDRRADTCCWSRWSRKPVAANATR